MLEKTPVCDFLFHLEYYLSFSGQTTVDKKLWGFWCDGIYTRYEEEELRKIINDKRYIELPINFGQDGQEAYTLFIYFGRKSLSRNARGLDLSECLPDLTKETDMISIDTENKIVELQLK